MKQKIPNPECLWLSAKFLHKFLANFSTETFEIEHGMRIAQVIVAKYEQFPLEIVQELTETQRGSGGFGSTGR